MTHRLDIRVYFPVTMSLYLFQAFPYGWLYISNPMRFDNHLGFV